MIILVSAANSDVCQSMARILRMSDNFSRAKLIGLSPDSIWPAKQYYDEVIHIPMANSPAYPVKLEELINRVKPDYFIPFSEAELAYFVENPGFLRSLSTKSIINPTQVLKTFLDKKNTSDFLHAHGVQVPKTYDLNNLGDGMLPLIIKPRKSAGSKNMAIIRNKTSLQGFLEDHKNSDNTQYIAQELIDEPDAEFTCALWRGGENTRFCTLRRRLQGGMTGVAQVEEHPEINSTLLKIAGSIQGDFFINVQLRLRHNTPYVFEINPRFSSTLMMRHKIGFEDFIWTLNWTQSRSMPPVWTVPIGAKIFRVSEECVVNGEIS